MSIASRLTKLENMRPSRIVLLARMPDGSEMEMSATEYVNAVGDGAEMVLVLRGNDLRDVDLILGTIHSVIDRDEYN